MYSGSWGDSRPPQYHAGIKDYMQSAILFELIAKLITVTVTVTVTVLISGIIN